MLNCTVLYSTVLNVGTGKGRTFFLQNTDEEHSEQKKQKVFGCDGGSADIHLGRDALMSQRYRHTHIGWLTD